MLLIGMFDSPFVRRVAISLHLSGMAFEHRDWSVGKDQAAIRRYNPLGRVPTLVLEDGESLIESAAILDWIDEQAGPERALLPARGAARRRALQLMAIASGAADKAVSQLYEGAFRPPEKRHEPWVARCRSQMQDALAELDRQAVALPGEGWWLGGTQLSQVDITVSCVATFVHEALRLDPSRYPSLMRRVKQCESLPAFRAHHLPFFTPQSDTAGA